MTAYFRGLARALRFIAATIVVVCFACMTIAVLAQVFGRYRFNYTISWTEETANFAQIGVVFIGAGIAMRRGWHVALVSNLSVGAMFLAGVLPGLLTVPGPLASAYLHARRGGPRYRDTEPFHLARLRRAFRASLPALVRDGYSSLKICMTCDDLKLDDGQILDVLAAARRTGGMVVVHAENAECIGWLTDRLEEAGRIEPRYHATSRPRPGRVSRLPPAGARMRAEGVHGS